MDTPGLERFAELRGESFTLQVDGNTTLAAALVEVQPLDGPVLNGRRPFALLFRGPPLPQLPQRIYRIAHDRLPELDIFLVPVRGSREGVCYEAVFN